MAGFGFFNRDLFLPSYNIDRRYLISAIDTRRVNHLLTFAAVLCSRIFIRERSSEDGRIRHFPGSRQSFLLTTSAARRLIPALKRPCGRPTPRAITRSRIAAVTSRLRDGIVREHYLTGLSTDRTVESAFGTLL